MGYAFTFPIFRLWGGCQIGCYVHYPTISTDMLALVRSREGTYNNKSSISRSPVFSTLKLWYYHLFAHLYGFVGSFARVAMVNSSWTQGHINTLWKMPRRTFKVYPPCDTGAFQDFQLEKREQLIVSVAQFRPEKNHALQLRSVALLFQKHPEHREKVTLALIGSARNKEDEARIAALRELAQELAIDNSVVFVVNASFDVLKAHLGRGLVGIHTMWNEHFGIGVVEYMAAGLIPLAHNSAGPKMDIVTVGYLAETAEEYATQLDAILRLTPTARVSIQRAAREVAVTRFSEKTFSDGFCNAFAHLMPALEKHK